MAQIGIYETYPMQAVPPHTHTTINEGNVLNMGDIINNYLAAYSSQHWSYDTFPDVPSVQADHFPGAALDPKWINWQPGGGLSHIVNKHHLIITNTGDNAYTWRGHFQAIPFLGDFTILIHFDLITDNPAFNYWTFGLALFEDAVLNPNTCKIAVYGLEVSAVSITSRITYLTNYNTWNSGPFDRVSIAATPSYYRIRRVGNVTNFEYSSDGVHWLVHWTTVEWFVPKEMGFAFMNYAAPTQYGISMVDWFYYHPASVLISPVGSKFK